tara:strand:- start:1828 stop:2550 length:723 start_codon:yes stop_codon:yes gene_type:complete
MPDYSILKVKDKTDSYYTHLKDIFDIPFRLIIVGKSFLSGKSTVILNLLLRDSFYKDHFKGENIYIISNNKMDAKMRILKSEKDIDPSHFMEFSEENLEMIYDEVEENALEHVSDGKKPPNSLIVLDDVAFTGALKEKINGTLSRIVCNGRHINLSIIVTSQKYSQLSTVIRTNVSGAILFGNSAREVEAMEQDMNYLDSKKEFTKMFRAATKGKNKFMVVSFSNDEIYLDSEFKPIVMD